MKYVNMYTAQNVYKEIDSLYRAAHAEAEDIRKRFYDPKDEFDEEITFDGMELMMDNLERDLAMEINYIVTRYEKSGRSGNFRAELEEIGMLF